MPPEVICFQIVQIKALGTKRSAPTSLQEKVCAKRYFIPKIHINTKFCEFLQTVKHCTSYFTDGVGQQ